MDFFTLCPQVMAVMELFFIFFNFSDLRIIGKMRWVIIPRIVNKLQVFRHCLICEVKIFRYVDFKHLVMRNGL